MGGGTFAVLPAYEADLYGSKYVGAIHGRFLTFGAAATVAGPMLLLNLRKIAEVNAINELLTKVDPQVFLSKFGVAVSEAPSLIEAKTLTISKLMTIMPLVQLTQVPSSTTTQCTPRQALSVLPLLYTSWSDQSTKNTLKRKKKSNSYSKS